MKSILLRMTVLVLAILIFIFLSLAMGGNEKMSTPNDQSQYYLYTLQLIQPLLNLDNWTEKENKIVEKHFQRLKQFRDEGVVIFAGRVSTMDPEGFGIVIFKADSQEDALAMMENDPAVREGIMSAELFPFSISLMQIPTEFELSENNL